MCVFRRPLALQPSKIDVIEERERASVLRRLRSTAERQLGATVLLAMSKRSRVALELDSKETVHDATSATHSIERPSEGSSGQVFGEGSEALHGVGSGTPSRQRPLFGRRAAILSLRV